MNILLLITLTVGLHVVNSQKIVCYYGAWAVYRSGDLKFTPANIDPFKCTHLIYAFIGLEETGQLKLLDVNSDVVNIKTFNALKNMNPNLKTLVAIGGWNEGSARFSSVASDPEKRGVFAKSARDFLQKYGFDGLDLDWEYPAQRDGNVGSDKQNFVLLLQDVRTAFSTNGLLLTAAVAASENSASQSYNIPKISAALDHIHLMTYDYAGAWTGKTDFNAPLLAIDAAVKYWVNQGAPKSKLILGIPLYGKSFTLSNAANNAVGVAVSGDGMAGPAGIAGTLGYNEICPQVKANKWTVLWNVTQAVPYAFNGDQWVSYDNVQSTSIKAKYAADNQLGGAMVWSIESDDFLNICGDGKFPLMTAISKGLNGGKAPTTTASAQTSTNSGRPITPTTVAPSSLTFTCVKAGIFPDPANCFGFINCDSGLNKYVKSCPNGLAFNPKLKLCDWTRNVKC